METKNSALDNDRYTYEYFCQDYVCRLCWSSNAVLEITSYNPTSNEKDDTIAQKILECVGIDVTHSFPKKVCSKCANKVEMFTDFKRLCKKTEVKLHSILRNSSPWEITIVKVEKEENAEISNAEAELLHKIQLLEATFEENLDKAINLKKEYDYQFSKESDYSDDLFDDFPENHDATQIGGNLEEKIIHECPTCHILFDSMKKLIEHAKKCCDSEENRLLKCIGCGKRFKELKRTFNSRKCQSCAIAIEKVYKCRKCSEGFESFESLQKHKEQNHQRSCVCEICGKVYSCRGNLNIHKWRHEAVKRFKCSHCDFRSAQPSSLITHTRIHTGERPYACDMCPYRCINSSNLNKHRKVHLNMEEFECTICKRRFPLKHTLNEHISTVHLKEKNHICPKCGNLYSRFRNLRNHMLVKHGQKVRKCRDKIIEVASGIVYKRAWKKKVKDLDSSFKERSCETPNTDGADFK